jgi:hypothetical protein
MGISIAEDQIDLATLGAEVSGEELHSGPLQVSLCGTFTQPATSEMFRLGLDTISSPEHGPSRVHDGFLCNGEASRLRGLPLDEPRLWNRERLSAQPLNSVPAPPASTATPASRLFVVCHPRLHTLSAR